MLFRDLSFVLPYKEKCEVASGCPSVMIFDKSDRPVAKLIQNPENSTMTTKHIVYQNGHWHESKNETWYNVFEVDQHTPRLDLPNLRTKVPSNNHQQPPILKTHDKVQCELSHEASGVLAGAIAGGTIGSVFPGVGTLFGAFIGLVGGVFSGYLAGSVTAHSFCG